jgi:hypothetical protein
MKGHPPRLEYLMALIFVASIVGGLFLLGLSVAELLSQVWLSL